MVSLLLMIGLFIEIALGAYVLLLTRMEKKVLSKLVSTAGTDFISSVDDLPDPYRRVARALADQLAMEQDFDDALLEAVVEATREPFKKPLWMRLSVGAICAVAALAPASYGLMTTAMQIVSAWNEAKVRDRSVTYLLGQTELEGPFLELRDAFQGSALLFFGLAFLWALAWYLRRPEVREARFVRTLLEAAAKASPSSAAPASGRMSELIAPDRGLGRPITALLICLSGITAGWLVLYETADVRAANDRDPIFDVWPAKQARLLATAAGVMLPTARAGEPLDPEPPPSLTIGPDKVSLGGTSLVTFSDNELPEKWQSEMPEQLGRMLMKAGGRVVVLAHRQLRLDLVLDVLLFLKEKHDIDRFELIVERTLETGAPGGRPLHAGITLEISAGRPSALTIEIHEGGIKLPGIDAVQPYEESRWQDSLQRLVREKGELLRSEDRAVVQISVLSREIAYSRFVEVLAAADTACMHEEDCGLPGLGLEFTIPAAPNP